MEEKENEIQRLLLKESMQMEEREAFTKLHKEAFRIAYNYLDACFPPAREDGYWDDAAKKMLKLIGDNKANLLVAHLLLGAYDYLGKIAKDLPER